ncbi:MAG: TonB family protein [Candidatus Acidiferrales bacterium]
MTPLKETLEVGQVPASQEGSRPKPDSGHLRSDAVSLDVPVKVHGSRVVEVVRGTTSHTEPFEEQTSTMIVFPLGGVLKMNTQVSVGQAIVLTNLKTRQDAICRVIKTRTNPNLHCYVEVEFSHPQPGYWGVRFQSDGPEPTPKVASPAAAASSAPARVTPAPVAAPIATPVPKTEIPKPEIPKVETNEQKAAPPAPAVIEKPASTAGSVSFSLEQLRGDTSAAPLVPFPIAEQVKDGKPHQTETYCGAETSGANEAPAAHEPSTFGRFAASAAADEDHAPARPAFGAGLEYSPLGTSADKNQKEGKNWALIAACVGLLLAAAGGGGYYFLFVRQRPVNQQRAAITAPAVPQGPVAANPVSNPTAASPAPIEQAPATPAPGAAEPTGTSLATPSPVAHSREPERSQVSESAPNKPAQSAFQSKVSQSAKQKAAPAVPDMFGALNAHPTTAVHTDASGGGTAPSIDAGALAGGQNVALPSTESMPANLPPPPQQQAPTSEAPVQVGGDIMPPRLISAPPVVYPEMARQAGIGGDVVVRIVIDKSGKVTEAKAISGPMLLRDAAVSALRDRKYVPSKLDGRPISLEMLVTIQFHR